MADLKIQVFKSGEEKPETTVTIPGDIIKVAYKLFPKRVATALQDNGIDIDKMINLATNRRAQGTLVEVEEHKEKKRIVISLE